MIFNTAMRGYTDGIATLTVNARIYNLYLIYTNNNLETQKRSYASTYVCENLEIPIGSCITIFYISNTYPTFKGMSEIINEFGTDRTTGYLYHFIVAKIIDRAPVLDLTSESSTQSS